VKYLTPLSINSQPNLCSHPVAHRACSSVMITLEQHTNESITDSMHTFARRWCHDPTCWGVPVISEATRQMLYLSDIRYASMMRGLRIGAKATLIARYTVCLVQMTTMRAGNSTLSGTNCSPHCRPPTPCKIRQRLYRNRFIKSYSNEEFLNKANRTCTEYKPATSTEIHSGTCGGRSFAGDFQS
jgi:hypothetical protein